MGRIYTVKHVASILNRSQSRIIELARSIGLEKNKNNWDLTDADISAIRLKLGRRVDHIETISTATAIESREVKSIAKKFGLDVNDDYHKILAICSLWKEWENKSMAIVKDISIEALDIKQLTK